MVEQFLKNIEPAYEPCLARVANGTLDWKSRQVFGGFLAYIQTYTPAALRMFKPMTRAMLERYLRAPLLMCNFRIRTVLNQWVTL